MRPLNLRVGAGLLTFALGVVVAGVVGQIIRLWRLPVAENPPCSACFLLYRQEIPLVSVCELNRNFEQYRGKVVRVRGYFNNDAGRVTVSDDGSCALHAGFANGCEGCNGTSKALFVYSGWISWYDSSARVTVVGHAGPLEYPTLYADDHGFNIDCIESVAPLGSGLPERVKYTLGGLYRTFFH